MNAKEIRKYKVKVGIQLSEVADELEELYDQINFGPDLKPKDYNKLLLLEHTKDLVTIAANLFPYYEE